MPIADFLNGYIVRGILIALPTGNLTISLLVIRPQLKNHRAHACAAVRTAKELALRALFPGNDLNLINQKHVCGALIAVQQRPCDGA